MEETKKTVEATFKPAQLEESNQYAGVKDLLRVILDADKEYTKKEVDDLLEKALSKPVQEEINE